MNLFMVGVGCGMGMKFRKLFILKMVKIILSRIFVLKVILFISFFFLSVDEVCGG